MKMICHTIEKNFHIIIMSFAVIAFLKPEAFLWVQPFVKQMIGGIMFCMGATLKFVDFKKIITRPKLIFVGIFLQYTCMPLLAYTISKALNLPTEQMIGMVIVGSCPGGTASNLITFLSKGNVALSVTLTLCSTLLAPLLTPIILYALLAQEVPIDVVELMKSVFWIVFFPIMDALVIRHYFEKQFQKISFVFPTLAILLISLVVAYIIGIDKDMLITVPMLLFLAVVLHNGLGYVLGYVISKTFRFSETNARTIAIEVGMQNSGLGLALANQFFN
ncbi:MAG TPA: bile acid:sodium symporter family protein, partial [Flavobacteriaceae bacterium]|nr:bile acid:sodium symporter family protein [Flavobacteriaceae bacterium]